MQSHTRRALCVSLFILLLPLASLNAQDNSQVPTYRAGLKNIAIPPPVNELIELGPDYRVLLEPLAPDTNRLIAAFTLPADAVGLRGSGTKGMQEYALVEVPRRAEFATVTPEIFKEVENAMATQFGADLNASLRNQQDELNHKLKAITDGGAANIALEKPVQLGVLFSKPDACSFGMVMSVSSKGETLKVVEAITLMRVQERVIYAYLNTQYKDEDSVHWIAKAAESWADAILNANKPKS
jgi:hypothetical protein